MPTGALTDDGSGAQPGPEGERAMGYLDDDEDSGGHSLADTARESRSNTARVAQTSDHNGPL